MNRLLGVLALAATLPVMVPGAAAADDLCGSDPNCFVDDGDGFGSDVSGFVAIFLAFFVIAVVIAVGTAMYRVNAARDMARKAGLDEDAAGRVALLEENGLSAAYVASALRGRTPTPPAEPAAPAAPAAPARTVAERLAELTALKDSGAITEGEHAARRRAIIDSI